MSPRLGVAFVRTCSHCWVFVVVILGISFNGPSFAIARITLLLLLRDSDAVIAWFINAVNRVAIYVSVESGSLVVSTWRRAVVI